MTPDQHRRLLDLFVAYSQENLTETEREELQGVLRTDVEARKLWFLHQDLELGLRCLTQVVIEGADHQGEGVSVGTRAVGADVEPGIHLPTSSGNSPRVASLATGIGALPAVEEERGKIRRNWSSPSIRQRID